RSQRRRDRRPLGRLARARSELIAIDPCGDIDPPPDLLSDLHPSMADARPTRRIFCASLGATLVPIAGCARRAPRPVPPTPSAPEIAATHRGTWNGKITVHNFDVKLQNPAAAPRWMIFPSDISVSDTLARPLGRGLSNAIYTYRLSDRPRVILVE